MTLDFDQRRQPDRDAALDWIWRHAEASRRADAMVLGVIGLSSTVHSGGDDGEVMSMFVSLQTQVYEGVGP